MSLKVRGAHRMELPGTKQRHEHISDRAVHDFIESLRTSDDVIASIFSGLPPVQ